MNGGWLDKQMLKGLYFLFTIGVNVVAGTMVGYGIGWWLDERLFHGRTSPWFTVALLLLGTVAGFLSVFSILRSRTAKKMREELGIGDVTNSDAGRPPGEGGENNKDDNNSEP